MNTITGKVNAYITDYSTIRPEEFAQPNDRLIPKFYYSTANGIPTGWTLAGEATIIVQLVDQDEIITNKVAALNGQLQKHRADSHVVEKRLEDQISKLLAISY